MGSDVTTNIRETGEKKHQPITITTPLPTTHPNKRGRLPSVVALDNGTCPHTQVINTLNK